MEASPNAPINPLEAYNKAQKTIPAELREAPKPMMLIKPLFQYDPLGAKPVPGLPPLSHMHPLHS